MILRVECRMPGINQLMLWKNGRNGNINLWSLYNLFTGTNKSSYIDQYLERGVNTYEFAEQIRWALEGKSKSWHLN